jgi:hypothetical protein
MAEKIHSIRRPHQANENEAESIDTDLGSAIEEVVDLAELLALAIDDRLLSSDSQDGRALISMTPRGFAAVNTAILDLAARARMLSDLYDLDLARRAKS